MIIYLTNARPVYSVKLTGVYATDNFKLASVVATEVYIIHIMLCVRRKSLHLTSSST